MLPDAQSLADAADSVGALKETKKKTYLVLGATSTGELRILDSGDSKDALIERLSQSPIGNFEGRQWIMPVNLLTRES